MIEETTKNEAEVIDMGDEGEALMTFTRPPVSEKETDFIGGDEPEPTETDAATGPDELRGTLDDHGGEYDPSKHQYPPEKTRTGRWKKLPRNRAGASAETNTAYRAAAQQYAMLYGNAHVSFFGKDGAIDKDALSPLIDAIEAYMVENGISELDPKWQVVLASVNYSTVICTREPNAAKIKRWFAPVKNFFAGLFGRKQKIEIAPKTVKQQADEIRAQSDQRDDGFEYPDAS